MKNIAPFILFLFTLFSNAQTKYKNGDLLFNVVNMKKASEFSRSIVGSTHGIDEKNISHVAIVCKEDSGLFVLEATGRHGVWMCPLDSFLSKAHKDKDGKTLILHARVKGNIDIKTSVANAKRHIGKKYDYIFNDSDEEFYCSELVQKSFVDKKGNLIFQPIPMSFHDDAGNILPYWTTYYSKKGLVVPEGAPGSNPGALSRHKRTKILDLDRRVRK